VALPFAINLVSNLIFTPIQFGMRNLPLAAVDFLIVWATINWRWSPSGPGPSAVFRVSLAGTVLQLSITAMN
jgi:tryptophan-rich sensory protein